jgi:hypothetical protein
LLIITASCKKDNGPGGVPPVVTRVGTSLDHSKNLSAGDMNQWIMIFGANLKGATAVFFGDIEIPYAEIYSSDTSVSVKIPRKIPAQNAGQLKVVTPSGMAVYNFSINTPDFTFRRLKNEYTPEGDTLEIEGAFLDLYFEAGNTKVTFTGGKVADALEVTDNLIKVKVPAGAGAGPVTVKNSGGLNAELVTNGSWYKDDRNFILVQPVVEPATGLITSHADFPNSPGPMMVRQRPYVAWTWDVMLTAFVNIPAAAKGPGKANYNLKFEMMTRTPITKGSIQFNFGSSYWPWPFSYYGPALNTSGKWETLSIPLTEVGNPADEYPWFILLMSDGEARDLDFAMCNFRVVPKN